MPQLIHVVEALDFVERHLKEEIGVADMADAAGYSVYHFCRVFNSFVHHTPYDYLMRRRLSESARSLLETDWNIVDVAFEYRFNSHETYSRAFKRMFGVPPSRYRALDGKGTTTIDRRIWMPPLTIDYLQYINQGGRLKPDLVRKGALRLTGLMSIVVDTEGINHLWETLTQALAQIRDDEGRYDCYGLSWRPAEGRLNTRFYLAAVEAGSGPVSGEREGLHPAFVMKKLPPLAYARFVHRGSRADLDLTRSYIYHTWLPQSAVRVAYPMEVEHLGLQGPGPEHQKGRWDLLVPIE